MAANTVSKIAAAQIWPSPWTFIWPTYQMEWCGTLAVRSCLPDLSYKQAVARRQQRANQINQNWLKSELQFILWLLRLRSGEQEWTAQVPSFHVIMCFGWGCLSFAIREEGDPVLRSRQDRLFMELSALIGWCCREYQKMLFPLLLHEQREERLRLPTKHCIIAISVGI